MNSQHRLVLALSALTVHAFACQIEVEAPPEDAEPSSFRGFEDTSERAPWGGLEPPGGWDDDAAEDVYANPPPALDAPWFQYRELIALDPQLTRSPLAANANPDTALSFRAQMQWLAGSGENAAAFTAAWLEQWADVTAVGAELAPVAPRPRVRERLIEPWLGTRVPSSTYDAGYALSPPLASWEQLPFELIAIVNRVDLARDPCSGSGGELRYVYTAVDTASRRPLDTTVIVEIPYPTTRPAAHWASRWQALSQLVSGPEYASAIEALARDAHFEADPLRVRVRTNDLALAEIDAQSWELREFHLKIEGGELLLAQVPLELTPRADADPAALAAHVLSTPGAQSGSPLPLALQAGAAQLASPDFTWPVLGVSSTSRLAFSTQTCNGCHGGDTRALPFQHIAAGATLQNRARLSPFLYDPDTSRDELNRRARVVAEMAQAVCAPPAPPPYPGG